jgi:hydrogenase nickel incorporation protein HypA/HybF
MHELAICQSLMRQVETIAQQEQARRIISITLRIGPLSGVESELLQQAFPVASAGTVAEHALLKIESQPVRIHCSRCESEHEVPPNRLLCPQCGEQQTRLVSGDELLLASLELDRPEP